MKSNKRIFIIGQPGAGKWLLAKTVAAKLNWQSINADLGLEGKTGCSVNEMFGDTVLSDYYNFQHKILQSLLAMDNIVVATDINVVSNQACKDLLENEFVVYLEVSTKVQVERLGRNKAYLLAPESEENFLNALHAAHDKDFEQVADYVLNSDENTLDEHVVSLVEIFNEDNIESVGLPTLEKDELLYFNKKDHSPVQLSTRQAQCLKLLAQGKSVKVIAKEIDLSHRTVEEHIANTMKVLGCASSKELVALYHSKI